MATGAVAGGANHASVMQVPGKTPNPATERYVAYERVSTARQGTSGLGLEAQRQTIEGFATSRGAQLIGRYTEVESGRKADRPELIHALHLAKVTGATLIIAKLDRLSRNAAFLLTLRDSGVRLSPMDVSTEAAL